MVSDFTTSRTISRCWRSSEWSQELAQDILHPNCSKDFHDCHTMCSWDFMDNRLQHSLRPKSTLVQGPDLDPSFQKEGLVGRSLGHPAEWTSFYLFLTAHYFLEESNSCDSLSLVLNGWWHRQSWRYSQLLHFAPFWNKLWPKHCIPVPRLNTVGNLWKRFE